MALKNIAIVLPCALLLSASNFQTGSHYLMVDAFGTFSINTQQMKATVSTTTSTSTQLKGSKWDNLVDEEDEDEFEPQGPEVRKDMRYIEFNIIRQNKHFVAIREAGGPEVTNDIYARDPDSSTFFFVGKVACISDVSVEKAIARQYALIEEHSARLRPSELYSKKGSLEIWVAPGDSEMDVAYNRPHIRFLKMNKADEVDGADEVRNLEVGFQGEIYDSDEDGFRTWRTEDGLPMKDEIKEPQAVKEEKRPPTDEEKRSPTDEEMAKINDMLKGQDLNELFENQQE